MKLCMGCMENIEDNVTTCPHCGYDETTLRQESYYLDPGTVVGGKYIVGRVISYGGYTITYLGMDAENNQKVMVKEYLPSDFSTRSDGETEVTIYSGDALEQFEQGLTTFLNEANRIQHLNNVQGIAKVYDCVAENDTGYVISEYVEGQTLKEILDAGKLFTPQEAKVFICQILEGLRQVHPLDIIHCDISPETIMLTNMGEIKLMDFGATRYVTTANSKSLAIILKQGYAPEEQYRSRGVRGPWTDVYALGAVMYRMITGKVPTESVDRALQDELKEPSQLGIAIPQNLENALMNALNVYQSDRTPSAEVFLRELNSPEVRRIQVKKRKNDTGKFPKWAKGLVAGLLCLILVGGGIVGYQLLNPEDISTQNGEGNVPGITGKTVEKATGELKEIGLAYKEIKFMYDPNLRELTEVTSQSIAKGTPLVNVKGKKMEFSYKTREKCHYSDLDFTKNVNQLAEYLNLDREKQISAATENGCDDESHTYYELYSILLNDGTKIMPNRLKSEKRTVLKLSKISKLTYYVSPFFYVESLENYEGKQLSQVKFQKYKYDDKNKKNRIEVGEPDTPSNYVRGKYYSLNPNKGKGYIVKQNIEEGKVYDSSEEQEAIFDVVDEVIDIKGLSYEEAKRKLKAKGIGAKNISLDDGNSWSGGTVSGYTLRRKDGAGKEQKLEDEDIFEKSSVSEICIKLTTTPKPTERPTDTPQPTPKPPSENDGGTPREPDNAI